jgi:hypothetical protein
VNFSNWFSLLETTSLAVVAHGEPFVRTALSYAPVRPAVGLESPEVRSLWPLTAARRSL